MPNRPLPSSKNPHFQSEAKCTTFLVKRSFICVRMNNHFHIKDWELNPVLIQRLGGTRKWPILLPSTTREGEGGAGQFHIFFLFSNNTHTHTHSHTHTHTPFFVVWEPQFALPTLQAPHLYFQVKKNLLWSSNVKFRIRIPNAPHKAV